MYARLIEDGVRRKCYQCHTTYRIDLAPNVYGKCHPTYKCIFPDPNLCPTCARSRVNNIVRELDDAEKTMHPFNFEGFVFKKANREEDRQEAIEVGRWLKERRQIVESPQQWTCGLCTPESAYQTNGPNASFYLSEDPRYGFFPRVTCCPACSEVQRSDYIRTLDAFRKEGETSDEIKAGALTHVFTECWREQRVLHQLGRLPDDSGEAPIVPEITLNVVAVQAPKEATQRDRGCCIIL
jgi:hypothetical protein